MDTSPEEWRGIPSVPEYQASNWGRLRRIPVRIAQPNGGYRVQGGTPFPGTWDGRRYVLNRRNAPKKIVARLVCEAFNGPAPPRKNICMHLDENSRNNRPENLVWGTNKENMNFPKYLEYRRSRSGPNSSYWISVNRIMEKMRNEPTS